MNALTVAALMCALGLLAGVTVARFVSIPNEETRMTDLLQNKLDALADMVAAGALTDQTRRAMATHLMRHLDTIVAMEDLLRAAPPVSVANAELVTTTAGAPELNVYFRPGHMHAWRVFLHGREFVEVGIGDHGMEFVGPFLVRLSYAPKRIGVESISGVAA